MTRLDGVSAALKDHYVIERELGRGGMAIVFLARDLKHGRPVALKVMQSRLSASLGADRFLFEIKTAAQLNHPHILPVFDSGQADGQLYYVMPHVAGESLRQRIDREGRLSVHDAATIACQVADALACAHANGIIHRDIKPENILLPKPDHAYVVDFGLAKAIHSAASHQLTIPGMVVGSPHYMSPEQAADLDVDETSDIYSLGCVLYEMLTGRPPFQGGGIEQIMAAHLAADPDPLTRLPRDIPPDLRKLVSKLLAKQPASRVQKASDLARQLSDLARAAAPARRSPLRRPATAAAALAVAILASLGVAVVVLGGGDPEADPDLLVVLPFRVVSGDSSLQYLGEGMVDLITAKLAGQAGPRPVDPQTALSTLRAVSGDGGYITREGAQEVGRRLTAGQLLMGEMVTVEGRLIVTARLVSLPGYREASPVTVEGPLDSLPELVDRLTAGVLSVSAREHQPRLAQLMSTSLPALREYLEGQSDYRQAAYASAVEHYRDAVALDSTFALAAMGLASAAGWTSAYASEAATGIRIAWRHRDRLSHPDRLYLTALAGPNYPEPSTYRQRLEAWDDVVTALPDRADAWYNFSEILLHWGRLLDLPDARIRARQALDRALDLDSTFMAPLEHLYHLAVLEQDFDEARRLGGMYVQRNVGVSAKTIAWQLSLLPDSDTSVARPLPSPGAGFETQALLVFFSQIIDAFTAALPVADSAVEVMIRQSPTAGVREYAWDARYSLSLNLGRPADAVRASESLLLHGAPPASIHRRRVAAALYWDGDTVAAAESARELARMSSMAGPYGQGEDFENDCVQRQWHLWRDPASSVARPPARPRADIADPSRDPAALCRLLIQAIGDHRTGVAPLTSVAHLDSILRTGPPFDAVRDQANLSLARIYMERGDYERAAAAARRRVLAPGGEAFLSTFLLLEADAAGRAGRTDDAERAYRHYLALRHAPEPELATRARDARMDLARLER